jgi:hypothetical protein
MIRLEGKHLREHISYNHSVKREWFDAVTPELPQKDCKPDWVKRPGATGGCSSEEEAFFAMNTLKRDVGIN